MLNVVMLLPLKEELILLLQLLAFQLITESEDSPAKADMPIVSRAVPIVIWVTPEQAANAMVSITVMPLGITIFVNPEQL